MTRAVSAEEKDYQGHVSPSGLVMVSTTTDSSSLITVKHVVSLPSTQHSLMSITLMVMVRTMNALTYRHCVPTVTVLRQWRQVII